MSKNDIKGPKREIFVAGIFAQIRPIWIGDLRTRPKNPKNYVWGLRSPFISRDYCSSAVGYSAKKNKNLELGRKKSCFRLLLYSLVWP
jgi:hypothetical protein